MPSDKLDDTLSLSLPLPLPLPPNPQDWPPFILHALGINSGKYEELPEIDEVVYDPVCRYLVIVLSSPWTRHAFETEIQPNIQEMHDCYIGDGLIGVIVTAKSSVDEYDFYSRFFAPWAGIDEDPVTGSAHSVLGPYWAKKLGKNRMKTRQCSKRGGEVEVEVVEGRARVAVRGRAVVVIRGELFL